MVTSINHLPGLLEEANFLGLSNGPSKKERGQRQRMQKGADCDIV